MIAADADDAPATSFGPVIRETTTKVLRRLEGIGRRAAEAGGSAEVLRGGPEFTVTVSVPSIAASASVTAGEAAR